jgi:translation initiation factor 2 gamma subunit (eIF-2gamma)
MMINGRAMLFKNSQRQKEKGMDLSALVSAVNTSGYKCLMFCESTGTCLMSNALLINY